MKRARLRPEYSLYEEICTDISMQPFINPNLQRSWMRYEPVRAAGWTCQSGPRAAAQRKHFQLFRALGREQTLRCEVSPFLV